MISRRGLALCACAALLSTSACATGEPDNSITVIQHETGSQLATTTDLPTDQTIAATDLNVPAGTWAYIRAVTEDTGTEYQVAIKINGLWRGEIGALSNRNYSEPAQIAGDLRAATPYYLSWSYLIVDGATDANPAAIVLPAEVGTLFNYSSAYGDLECPDYSANVARNVGTEVRRCAVTVSTDGSYPTGLAFAVPGQDSTYWFFDVTEITEA